MLKRVISVGTICTCPLCGSWGKVVALEKPTCPLCGSRGKVVALEKPRISSPNTKQWTCAEHRSNRLAAFFKPRRARPEGKKHYPGKSQLFFGEMSTFDRLGVARSDFFSRWLRRWRRRRSTWTTMAPPRWTRPSLPLCSPTSRFSRSHLGEERVIFAGSSRATRAPARSAEGVRPR